MRHAAVLIGALVLSACTSIPATNMPGREDIHDFSLESRFALSIKIPEQAKQSGSGRLNWRHQHGDNFLMIANPLGFAIAEIETTAEGSQLRMADGKTLTSADPDLLIEEVTGQRLPVTSLSRWLLGRAKEAAEIDYDPQKRPTRLRESGWQVDYFYEDDTPSALPSRLTLSRGNEIELRLRIEEWKENP
jgi:outer membrane lipoprotein LolB